MWSGRGSFFKKQQLKYAVRSTMYSDPAGRLVQCTSAIPHERSQYRDLLSCRVAGHEAGRVDPDSAAPCGITNERCRRAG